MLAPLLMAPSGDTRASATYPGGAAESLDSETIGILVEMFDVKKFIPAETDNLTTQSPANIPCLGSLLPTLPHTSDTMSSQGCLPGMSHPQLEKHPPWHSPPQPSTETMFLTPLVAASSQQHQQHQDPQHPKPLPPAGGSGAAKASVSSHLSPTAFKAPPSQSIQQTHGLTPRDGCGQQCRGPQHTHAPGGPPKLPPTPRRRPHPPTDGRNPDTTITVRQRPDLQAHPPDGHSGVRLFRFLLNELERSEGPDDRGRALAWVDKRRGVFRIVRKKEIADRWGRAKNNNSMTYEKFSRSLRYYYKVRQLERVANQHLVYKFGSNAHKEVWDRIAGLSQEPVLHVTATRDQVASQTSHPSHTSRPATRDGSTREDNSSGAWRSDKHALLPQSFNTVTSPQHPSSGPLELKYEHVDVDFQHPSTFYCPDTQSLLNPSLPHATRPLNSRHFLDTRENQFAGHPSAQQSSTVTSHQSSTNPISSSKATSWGCDVLPHFLQERREAVSQQSFQAAMFREQLCEASHEMHTAPGKRHVASHAPFQMLAPDRHKVTHSPNAYSQHLMPDLTMEFSSSGMCTPGDQKVNKPSHEDALSSPLVLKWSTSTMETEVQVDLRGFVPESYDLDSISSTIIPVDSSIPMDSSIPVDFQSGAQAVDCLPFTRKSSGTNLDFKTHSPHETQWR